MPGRQVLEELAITVQAQLGDRLPLPFCAFNGGADVFVDLGNKSLGLEVPPRRLSLKRGQTRQLVCSVDPATFDPGDPVLHACACAQQQSLMRLAYLEPKVRFWDLK